MTAVLRSLNVPPARARRGQRKSATAEDERRATPGARGASRTLAVRRFIRDANATIARPLAGVAGRSASVDTPRHRAAGQRTFLSGHSGHPRSFDCIFAQGGYDHGGGRATDQGLPSPSGLARAERQRSAPRRTRSRDRRPPHRRSLQDRALIARGGMGKVYRAEQAPLGRVCALKVLNPDVRGRARPRVPQALLPRGEHRVEAHAPEHRHDLRLRADRRRHLLHGDGVPRGAHAPPGHPRGGLLPRGARRAHRPAGSAARSARRTRSAVIHRDLKPANIFLVEHGDETDFVKVLDFGLVKNVSRRQAGGSAHADGLFMGSPEVHGARADPRRAGRRAHRHLLARHHHVRDARRARCPSIGRRASTP